MREARPARTIRQLPLVAAELSPIVSVEGGVTPGVPVAPSTPPVGDGASEVIGSSDPVGASLGGTLGGVDGGTLGGVLGGTDGGVLGGTLGGVDGGTDGGTDGGALGGTLGGVDGGTDGGVLGGVPVSQQKDTWLMPVSPPWSVRFVPTVASGDAAVGA